MPIVKSVSSVEGLGLDHNQGLGLKASLEFRD